MGQTMPETPTRRFAAYPRPGANSYGTVEQLRCLVDAYNGMTALIAVWVLLLLLLVVTNSLPVALLGLCGLMIYAGFKNANLGAGMGWSASRTATVRLLFALAFVFTGPVPPLVLQTVAVGELKRYGIKPGFIGLSQADLDRKIGELKTAEALRALPTDS
jgi:hypothetical protein